MRPVLRTALACFALATTFALPAFVSAQQGDPGMGTWKLNVEKSKFDPGPAPKSLTTKFEAAGEGVRWSSERIGTDGRTIASSYTGNYDGKDYPINGSPGADVVVLRRIDAFTTERVNKKEGVIVSTERRQVAKDGKSYTTSVQGTTGKGTIDHRMVFEKQ